MVDAKQISHKEDTDRLMHDGPNLSKRTVNALIEIRNVSKEITHTNGHIQQILSDITLDVLEGEFLCILGPSGCGKTTLLHLCAGFDSPTSGAISMDGASVTRPSSERVVIFQDSGAALFGWMDIRENVDYALRLKRMPKAARSRRASDLLELVGLSRDASKYPHQLSGGGKQRAQIARALASDPRVLLMDEPLGALDALTKRSLQLEFVNLASKTGKTVLYITHDVIEAALISDRIAILSEGPASRLSYLEANTIPHPRHVSNPDVAALAQKLEDIIMSSAEART